MKEKVGEEGTYSCTLQEIFPSIRFDKMEDGGAIKDKGFCVCRMPRNPRR